MFDYLLNEDQKKLRDETRDFVKSIPRKMILDMDADIIQFPKEFLQEAGRRNLMGCRYPKKWGGRGMDWVSTCMVMEEVGTLGYIFACTFGVGAELVCDAIILHGNDAQKEKYVKPLLAGEIFAAECLTEPRASKANTCTALWAAGGEAPPRQLTWPQATPQKERRLDSPWHSSRASPSRWPKLSPSWMLPGP